MTAESCGIVTEWLRLRSLSEVVSPVLAKGGQDTEANVDFSDACKPRWTYSSRRSFVYTVEQGVLDSWIFFESELGTDPTSVQGRRPLLYSQELRAWMSPGVFWTERSEASAPTEARLPETIARWLARRAGWVHLRTAETISVSFTPPSFSLHS